MSFHFANAVEMAAEHIWEFSIVALVLAGTVVLCTRRRPQLAHALLILVMLKAVTPPVLISRFAIPSGRPWATDSRAYRANVTGDMGAAPATYAESSETMSRTTVSGVAAGPLEEGHIAGSVDLWKIAGVAWAVGVLLVLLIRCLQAVQFFRLLRRAEYLRDGQLLESGRQAAHCLGVQRPVRLAVSAHGLGPAVIGVLRPTIVLPVEVVSRCSPVELKAIITHELVHVRRNDVAFAACQTLIQALWWFHPLVHWAHRRLTYERERCTDDAVLASGICSREEYANGLLGVLRIKHQLRPASGVAVGTRAVDITRQRLERIMSHKGFHQRMPWSCWTILVLGAAVVLPSARANDDNQRNGSDVVKELDVSSIDLLQVALPSQADDDAHPAASTVSNATIEIVKRGWPWSSSPLADLDTDRTLPEPMVIGGVHSALLKIMSDRDVTTIAPDDLYTNAGPHMRTFVMMTSEQAAAWQTAQGVDLSVEHYRDDDKERVRLRAHDLVAIPATSGSWDLTPDKVQSEFDAQAAKPSTSILVDDSAELPKTFIVQTRTGARGVLQVLAFSKSEPKTEWFRSAIIRYKLVKNSGQATAE